jgi:predicted metal-binding protein
MKRASHLKVKLLDCYQDCTESLCISFVKRDITTLLFVINYELAVVSQDEKFSKNLAVKEKGFNTKSTV